MLNKMAIAARLPHAGKMCLLDRVLHWDESSIRCAADSHHATDNPLRGAAGLATLAGIEYAAQAAAVHGTLLSGDAVPRNGAEPASGAEPRNGVLAALKNVKTAQPWLDSVAGEIVIEATLLHRDPAGGIFSFAVFDGARQVLSGQFTLMYIEDKGNPSL